MLDILPDDMLLSVINQLNSTDLLLLCLICRRFHNIMKSNEFLYLIRRKLSIQTGLDTNSFNIRILMRMCKLPRFKDISAGGSHSLILTNDGSVYSVGENISGQLGLGDVNSRKRPELIPNLQNIVAISAGASYSLVLNKMGQVYAFGNNIFGQLGISKSNSNKLDRPNDSKILIPTLVSISNIISIAAGERQSLLLTSEGTVYGFGENTYGQLGSKFYNNIHTPILIPGLENIIAISISDNHSLALNEYGQVYVFGDNTFGQLGFINSYYSISRPSIIPNINNIKQIATGSCYSILLSKDGSVHIFGYLSSEDIFDNISDIEAGSDYCLLLSDDNIYPVGQDVSLLIDNITSVSIGGEFLLMLTKTGHLYIGKDGHNELIFKI